MASESMDLDTTLSSATAPSAQSQNQQPTTQPSKKRSHSPSKSSQPSKHLTLTSPPWSYIHLQHHQIPQTALPSGLDALTAHLQITSALHQFLGLHGAAVPVDILKVQSDEVWIRVPSQDCKSVIAAVGGWVGRAGEGWRVKGWSNWSAGVQGRDGGRDLFEPRSD